MKANNDDSRAALQILDEAATLGIQVRTIVLKCLWFLLFGLRCLQLKVCDSHSYQRDRVPTDLDSRGISQ